MNEEKIDEQVRGHSILAHNWAKKVLWPDQDLRFGRALALCAHPAHLSGQSTRTNSAHRLHRSQAREEVNPKSNPLPNPPLRIAF